MRLLGTVGEPINPKAWLWYWKVIGGEGCPIVDTWWQTETGDIMITTLPGAQGAKPGSAGKPLPGIEAAAVLERGGRGRRHGAGAARAAAGRGRGCCGRSISDDDRYVETYFSKFGPGGVLRRRRFAQDADGSSG